MTFDIGGIQCSIAGGKRPYWRSFRTGLKEGGAMRNKVNLIPFYELYQQQMSSKKIKFL